MVHTPRGAIEVIEPEVFVTRFGTAAPETGRGAWLAAVRLAVRDMATAWTILGAAKIDFTERRQQLVTGAETAMGATLVFEPAG